MDRGTARTKKSRTLVEDLDAEDSTKKRSIFGDIEAEGIEIRGDSDDEDSSGSQDDEDISMNKQGSGTVYDRTPAKRGRWEPQDPAYTDNRKPRYLYKKKGDDSYDKEEEYKRKDAGNEAPDPKDSGDDGDDDSSKDKEEKVTNPEDAWTLFQSAYKLTPNVLRLWVIWATIQWMI